MPKWLDVRRIGHGTKLVLEFDDNKGRVTLAREGSSDRIELSKADVAHLGDAFTAMSLSNWGWRP